MGKTVSVLNEDNVILFDGVCNLCNAFIQFIIKRDSRQVFKFASLQSEFGQELIKRHSHLQNVDAVFFLENGEVFVKSTAALKIAGKLKYWSVFKSLLFVPAFIRDWIYDLIAKYRYGLFGKKNECMIPSPELIGRFIS